MMSWKTVAGLVSAWLIGLGAAAETPASRPEVTTIYPSASVVPENLLRLYIHFSEPMRRGSMPNAVALYQADGTRVTSPFLNLNTELWNATQTRLTLILDPGRIKRGVGPNALAGPPLTEGQSYRLEIAPTFVDANGAAMAGKVIKSFTVVAPERRALTPAAWSLKPVRLASRDALVIDMGRLIDRGGLEHAIRVETSTGRHLPGRFVVGTVETILEFSPDEPWSEEAYVLVMSTDLEDVAGNRVGVAFDASAQQKQREVSPVRVEFRAIHPSAGRPVLSRRH